MDPAFSAPFQQHRAALREAFGAWLAEAQPSSVLDVGAGRGELLASLAARSIPAEGIEASAEAAAEARARGLHVATGRATPLDREDRSVGWVVLRHVLHHLPDPERAAREALRVARDGVMFAEPLCWDALPAHRVTARLESFTRDLDRRNGRVHGADIAPGELATMIPASWSTEIRVHAPLHVLGADDVHAMIERSRGRLVLTSADQEHTDSLVEAATRGLLAAPGTVMVRARRPDAP